MSVATGNYDVVIVGAGIAGCTAARLYGLQGLRVALVDRCAQIDDYKRICTHFIQPSATPVIERLGLAPLIEAAGGVRNSLDTWTRWGWIRVPEPPEGGSNPYGYSIRRQTLDPMLRDLATSTPGVDLILGRRAERLVSTGGCFTGVVVEAQDGSEEELSASLIVAADGRDSPLGAMAGIRARETSNRRFAYFAYYRNLSLASGQTGQLWILEPDIVLTYPNDDDISIVACFVDKSRLADFKRDLEGSFERLIESLPLGPDFAAAKRVSPLLGKLEMPNRIRRVTAPGLAFVGDAAIASDPFWAVGCGWAFQSADWLVDSTAEALLSGQALDRALKRYRRKHRSLLPFYLQSANFSTRRKLLPQEKLLLSSAAKDPVMAGLFTGFGEGLVGIGELLRPCSVARALRVVLSRKKAEK